jgi:hypothetical protein
MSKAFPCAYRFERSGQLSPASMRYVSDLRVEWRGDDRWCIFNGSSCYNRLGEWEYERQPSSRDDEFISRCRYSRDDALSIASALVDAAT